VKEVILIKNGELALKGLNRNTFEDMMIKNIRFRLRDLGKFEYQKAQSTIKIEPLDDDIDFDEVVERISKVFGISAYSRAIACEKDFEIIKEAAEKFLGEELEEVSTFKVEAKRADKRFPMTSPEISRELGGYLLSKHRNLSVDVHNPDITVTVEIRDTQAFVRGNQLAGAGGMPIGSAGDAAIMISGGIDSPVAAYMMAKRGLRLTAIHFASPPYTSEKAEIKVHSLLSKVAKYSGRIGLLTVCFTDIQEAIRDNCPEEYFTLVMRRMMVRISQKIAKKEKCLALITGESLGQVASQTLPAIVVTDAVAKIPILRPLIGMDKREIIEISRMIDTFDISIEPFEDCCTVFTPKHPRTRPTIEQLEEIESAYNWDELIETAVNTAKFKAIN
jgi:thiamine biosynthesis protein ThiI